MDLPAGFDWDNEVFFRLTDEGLKFRCPHGGYWDDAKTEPIIHTLPVGGSGWTVVEEHPLTVTPSISKPDCGCHGFITAGVWVPA